MGISKKKYSRGGLLAPNGKPSNLNATQYELVRSKEFKDWFGDWENDPENASKVVDENGEPLVVYRGFPKKRKFPNVFEYKYRMFGKSGVSGREKNEFAFYFTDLKEVAEEYGKNLADDEEYVVKQYFLNIRNLFEAFSGKNQYQITFKELYDLANKSGEPIYELTPSGERALYIKGDGKGNYQTLPREWWEYDSFRRKYLYETTRNEVYAYFVDWDKKSSNQFFWRAYLQRYLNYDGVVFYERTHNDLLNPDRDEGDYYSIEKPWVLPEFGDEFSKTYGVFNSNQIKLADGTNTTFDGNNPDIRYEDGGITDDGEENFGKPLNFDERIFVHETNKEDANSILENGFKINENPVITNGVYTIPKNWKQNNIGRGGVELEIILKPNKKIFWTDTDRPMDYYLGFGNKFFTKLYKKLNKGEISPYQARVEMNDDNQYFKSKINFSRKMEKWLEDNGYVGIQQGGEVVLTDLSSFVIKNNFEKGGELKKDNVGWTIFGTIALIVTLGKVNALKK